MGPRVPPEEAAPEGEPEVAEPAAPEPDEDAAEAEPEVTDPRFRIEFF